MLVEAPGLIDARKRAGDVCHRPQSSHWDISLHAAIQADIRRVFNALTMPEYREVWISPPDADNKCRVGARQTRDTYRIDIYREGLLDTRITGSRRKWQLEEMEFTWRKRGGTQSTQTMVTICLLDKSGTSDLHLAHTGFRSVEESLWHQTLWGQSLEKLAWLLEQSHAKAPKLNSAILVDSMFATSGSKRTLDEPT